MQILDRLRLIKQRATLGKPYEFSFREIVAREYQFYSQYIKEGMNIIDVGAHSGENMAIFSRLCGPAGHVYCYEPIPPTFERLSKVIELMGKDNVTASSIALTNKPGIVLMEYKGYGQSSLSKIVSNNPGQGYESAEADKIGSDNQRFFQVPGDTLDNVVTRLGVNYVDLLKIDVEGRELDVLEGASIAFAERRIGCCVFEFGGFPGDKDREIRDLTEFFRSSGYRLENVVKGFPPFQKRKWDRRRFAMLIARPVEQL